jgi:putative ABC transport system permease protein
MLVTDIRLAARRLAATPGFFVTAVLTLALGMGANALLFSAVNGLLLRPMPVTDVDSLVWLFAESPDTPDIRETVSGDEGEAIARSAQAFEATAAIGDTALVRELDREHQRWRGLWATASLADVLRVTPAIGAVPRELPPDDAPRAMMLGYSRWQRDFGGDRSIVGRELRFADNKRFVVAGVLPEGLEFPFARPPHKGHGAGFRAGEQDYWILAPDAAGSHPGGVMIARLARGRDRSSAQSELNRLPITRAGSSSRPDDQRSLVVLGVRDQILGSLARALPLLQGFALLVLAIACANLASLMTAREAARRGDVMVRVALGASSADLLRLRAADAFVISALGALCGLGFAGMGRYGLVLMAPEQAALLGRIRIDAGVLAALGVAAMLATFAFGVLPGLWRRSTETAMSPGAARFTRHDVQRPLRILVVCQVALSMTLAASAVTLGQSLNRLLNVDAGYETAGVLAADTIVYIPNREAVPLLQQLRRRLLAIAGVEAVGFVHSTPLTGQWIVRDPFEVMEGPTRGQTPPVEGSFVAYDFFDVMRIPVIAGRTFSEADLGRRDFPVIINDIAARRFFPGRNPVGERIHMTNQLREIIGVVGATRDLALDAPAEAQWYQPGLSGTSQLVVRAGGVPNMPEELRREILNTDPRFIVQRIQYLDDIVAGTVIERRLAARLVGVFAAIALVLAGVGLYGVLSFGVAQRRKEFGIRAAIGANPAHIVRLLMGQGFRTTAVGIGLGAVLSGFALRLLQPLLFDSQGVSAVPVAAAALLLIIVAIAAIIGPALRAARTNPTVALTDL